MYGSDMTSGQDARPCGVSGEMESLVFGKPDYSEEEIDAVVRVMRSGWVGRGNESVLFESELAHYTGSECIVATSSCTAALLLSLKVTGVGPGDEVICPSLTWCSDANVIVALGARPVFCDVDPQTFCATAQTVSACVTEKTRAVILVHFGGLSCDVEAVRQALPDGIAVIEDAAHAFGARYPNGSPVGSSGNLTCFSFHANKNLSAVDGGAIALSDAKVAARLRTLGQHGLAFDVFDRHRSGYSLQSGDVCEPGFKMGLTDFHAAIGRVQLRRQPGFIENRLAVAKTYLERIDTQKADVRTQSDILALWHARHLFVVLLPTYLGEPYRDTVLCRLREGNVMATVHYRPLHHMPAYSYRGRPLPVTDIIARTSISMPIASAMSSRDAARGGDMLASIINGLPELETMA